MNETLSFSLGLPSSEGGWIPRALMSMNLVPYLLGIIAVMVTKYVWTSPDSSLRKLPKVNTAGFFSHSQARHNFLVSAKQMLVNARKLYPNQPYRMLTDYGYSVVVQSEWMNEIRNSPELSFFGAIVQERVCEVPGFEPLAALGVNGELIKVVTRKWLTRYLFQLTEPVSEEASFALSTVLGESTAWHEVTLMPTLLNVTARMSSRVFLGKELARNEELLEIIRGYTNNMLIGNERLRGYPTNWRPFLGRLPIFPECRRLRNFYSRGRELIISVMEKREHMKREASAAGQPAPVFNDALEWIEKESKERTFQYDVVTFQIVLSLVAVSTTADLLQTTLLDLIKHPEAMQSVRDEMVQVLKAEGWTKSSLYQMKLLDSVIKESQRVKPLFSSIRRSVDADIRLSDGTLLKKGSRLHIDTNLMDDPTIYEDPEEWKADRFLKMRSIPGKENMAQLVTTSNDHLGFGHGDHGCPGRFFAASELKIALCHLLLKYDWDFAPGTETESVSHGFRQKVNPRTRMLCRKREKVELDIDSV
ncbi:cytochrome P450 monooxygenase [Xylaria nigripes]|nr:cytochrome P450 monooxygenase [Xylaria nigripes]